MADEISNGQNIEDLYIKIDVSTEKSSENVKKLTNNLNNLEETIKRIRKYSDGKSFAEEQRLSAFNNRKATWTPSMYATAPKEIDSITERLFPDKAKASAEAMAKLQEKVAKYAASAKLLKSYMNADGKTVDVFGFKTKGGGAGTYSVINGEIDSITEKTKEARKASSRFGSVWKSIAHVIRYRAISMLINLIKKGLQDGIMSVAKFDKRFNATMSDIKGSIKQVVNQIGDVAAQTITALKPVIDWLLGSIRDLANNLSLALANMSGEKYYRRAKKNIEDYAAAAKKAFSGIGIDELNVFQESEKNDDFEYVEIEGDLKEQADLWSNIVASLTALVAVIAGAKALKGIVVLVEKLSVAIPAIVASVKEVAVWLAAGGAATLGVIAAIVAAVVALGLLIAHFKEQIHTGMETAYESVSEFFSNVSAGINKYLGWIGIVFRAIWDEVGGVIEFIVAEVRDLLDMAGALFSGDFKGFFANLGEALLDMVKGIANVFIPIINMFIDSINAIIDVINDITSLFGGKSVISTIERLEMIDFTDAKELEKVNQTQSSDAIADRLDRTADNYHLTIATQVDSRTIAQANVTGNRKNGFRTVGGDFGFAK